MFLLNLVSEQFYKLTPVKLRLLPGYWQTKTR